MINEYEQGYQDALDDVLDYIDMTDNWSPALEIYIGQLKVTSASRPSASDSSH